MASKINAPHRDTSMKFPAGLIDIEITGNSRDVEERIMGLERAFDPTLLMVDFLGRRVHDNLVDRAKDRFANEGDKTVGMWAELKPYTIEKRGGSAHPINVRTGAMKKYVLDPDPDAYLVGVGAALSFPKRGITGTLAKKVKTAQIGKERDKESGRTVPRPILGMDERDLEMTLVSLAGYIATHQPGGAAFAGV